MATRKIRKMDDTIEIQELNELASLIADFCDKNMDKFDSIKDSSEWADGYFSAVNTMRAIINGLPKTTVC